jgi:hypothetical protein
MDPEIEFLYRNIAKNQSRLMEHLQRMASGKAPFFSATLSLVYDKLIDMVFTEAVPTGFGFRESTEAAPAIRTLNPTASVYLPSTAGYAFPFSRQPPTPDPIPLGAVWLQCFQCRDPARVRDLYDGLCCPQCPPRGPMGARPLMRCPACGVLRKIRNGICARRACKCLFA